MAIWDRFKFWKKDRANTAGRVIPVGGQAIYPDPNTINFVNAFSQNASVYTIVSLAARKFGAIPRYVYKIEDPKEEQRYKALLKQVNYNLHDLQKLQKKAYEETLVENQLSELLARPNPTEGQDAFYEKLAVYYFTAGEGIIWLNRGDITDLNGKQKPDEVVDKMPVLEMYVLPPQYVEIIPDEDDVWGCLGYWFNVNGQRITLRKNDVIFWKRPNPNFDGVTRTHMRGLSPLSAGNKLITQDDASMDAAVAMQQNDGAKGILFEKTLRSPEQKTAIESVVNRRVNSRDMKSAVATLQGDWGYHSLSQTGVEMELLDTQSRTFQRICNLLGVHPMLFQTDGTYQNVEQARKDLITNLILVLACSLRDEMNRVLLPAFNLTKEYTHDVDITDLPELQEDMTRKITSLATAWWLTPNQKLKAMNEEQSTDELMNRVWMPTTLVQMEETDITESYDPRLDPKTSGLGDPDPLQDDTGKGDRQGLPNGKVD